MSTQTQTFPRANVAADAASTARHDPKLIVSGLAALGWLGGAAITQWWPALDDWPYTRELLILKLLFAVLSAGIGVAGWRVNASTPAASAKRLRVQAWLNATPWLLALSIGLTAWEVVTAQLEWLPRPFFAPPQALLAV
ncbi:hypothetical protein OKW33_007687 [Paraburkholderia atlantica]